jgi:glycosyltransferase involved in cell wall biosynthesis
MSNPFFSIIIPTFNREKHISETLESVISQSFGDFELLVIDNQSSDRTKEIVCSYEDERIFFYQNEQNFERCYSRNKGINLSKGKYILLLDSDDLYEPDHLSNWYDFILSDKTNSDCFYVSDKKILKENELSVQLNPVFREHPVCYFFLNPIIPGQVCIPSTIMKKYSFRNDLLIFEDAAMWMELSLSNKVAFNSISSFVYRLHEDNSVNEAVYNAYYKRLKVIKIIIKEKKYRRYLKNKTIRFSLNSCYLGIIRYHILNSPQIVQIRWIVKSIFLFPEYGFKNKILLFLNSLPVIGSSEYFRNRKLF